MKNNKYWISGLCLLIFTACEMEVKNIKLPDFQQKIVITSFISPSDTVSHVRIESNHRIYGELDKAESPGKLSATISDGVTEVDLSPSEDGFNFSPEDMTISEGKTYRLRVISDNGLSAEASCTVPSKRDFNPEADTTRIFYVEPGLGSYSQTLTRIYLTDPPGEDNYFRFSCKEVLYDPAYYYYPERFQLYGPEDEFFSDEGRDGKKFLINTITTSDRETADSAFLVLYLQHTDKSYFDYHKSFEKYSGGEEPFTEISPLFSNVSGGLGIFAAYTVDSLVIRLK